ncbi:MAG: GAF domain-containing protein [Anaerolineae bacterium]
MTATDQNRILVIDANNPYTLTSALRERFSFRVEHVADGQAALAALENAPVDVVLLNPHQLVPAAAVLLRTMAERGLSVPVIVLSEPANFDRSAMAYRHVVGWAGSSPAMPDLAGLIREKLAELSPASSEENARLPLARRAELLTAYDQLNRRVQELDTLFEVGKTVASLLDVEAILKRVVAAAVDLTEAEEGYLLLIDKATDDLYLRAQQNLGEEEARDFRVKVSDSIAGQVVLSGQPLMLSGNTDELKVKTGYTARSLINAPLCLDQEVIGVLGVINRQKSRHFGQQDLRLICALADWAAIAIRNARLYSESRQQARIMSLVNEVGQLLSSTLVMSRIPHLLLQRTTEIFETECGSISLIDENTQEIVFRAAYNGQGEEVAALVGYRLALGKGLVGIVAQDGEPLLVNDVREDPRWFSDIDRITGFTTQRVLAVPLKVEGHTLGVVELLNKRDGNFTSMDQQLLTAVASSAAIAIQNARQFEELREAHRALRAAQEQRIAAERWAILGKAAGNLAHRINNSTALVPVAVQDLRELLAEARMSRRTRQAVNADLDRIERNTLHTLNLAEELLRRFQHEPMEAHDLNLLARQALSLVDLPPNVRLSRNLAEHLPPVETSDLLTDVFVELITNALKAIEGSGRLEIGSKLEGDRVIAWVADTGRGIPSADRERVFDLFYTSDPDGLGFGLWWVKTFLQQQGGDVTVESHLHQGTRFTISLPVQRVRPEFPSAARLAG